MIFNIKRYNAMHNILLYSIQILIKHTNKTSLQYTSSYTCDVYIIIGYELCTNPERVYQTNSSVYCIMYMILYSIIFIPLYGYVFIVDRYMRLKFRRSKCGNTHIQSYI